ncbi:hypothetical protein L6452_21103 [Arctium lappa]|uniref:Uncharacterized protein n=1 Tax=Arctium lappa TaxID=4217 RepID=A0ACB9BHM9_ARCLA|nr:hypothetical protein L6452_21103 [Arctium lappa]
MFSSYERNSGITVSILVLDLNSRAKRKAMGLMGGNLQTSWYMGDRDPPTIPDPTTVSLSLSLSLSLHLH